jgi:hypothetical protein
VAEGDEAATPVRVLTADDVAAGTFTSADIVLPLPGYAVLYPANQGA